MVKQRRGGDTGSLGTAYNRTYSSSGQGPLGQANSFLGSPVFKLLLGEFRRNREEAQKQESINAFVKEAVDIGLFNKEQGGILGKMKSDNERNLLINAFAKANAEGKKVDSSKLLARAYFGKDLDPGLGDNEFVAQLEGEEKLLYEAFKSKPDKMLSIVEGRKTKAGLDSSRRAMLKNAGINADAIFGEGADLSGASANVMNKVLGQKETDITTQIRGLQREGLKIDNALKARKLNIDPLTGRPYINEGKKLTFEEEKAALDQQRQGGQEEGGILESLFGRNNPVNTAFESLIGGQNEAPPQQQIPTSQGLTRENVNAGSSVGRGTLDALGQVAAGIPGVGAAQEGIQNITEIGKQNLGQKRKGLPLVKQEKSLLERALGL